MIVAESATRAVVPSGFGDWDWDWGCDCRGWDWGRESGDGEGEGVRDRDLPDRGGKGGLLVSDGRR